MLREKKIMSNNKDNQNVGSRGAATGSSMDSDRELENQKRNDGSGSSGQGQQAGGSEKDIGSKEDADDNLNTAGGREGQFSDKDRDSDGQWSPGASGGSSDE